MHLNIALGFDEKYAPYASVTIMSVMENTKTPVVFYLMHDNVSAVTIEKITKMIEDMNHKAKWFNLSEDYKGMFVGSWSAAMFYPLSVSKICDEDRILFLDSDTLVTEDLTEFYNQDMDNNYVIAGHDYGMYSLMHIGDSIKISDDKRITIKEYFNDYVKWSDDDMKRYFNSGMLLCNLDVMRKENVYEKFLDVIKNKQLGYPDQDCYNFVCHDRVKLTDMKYNFMILNGNVWSGCDKKILEKYNAFYSEKEKPVIIHFLLKPWRVFEGIKVPYTD